MSDWVKAFAPASIGNVAVGFDMLGLAIADVGDRVLARRVSASGVTIAEIRDPSGAPHPELSANAGQNTASVAAAAVWDKASAHGGLEIVVQKGVPLQSGMGSSAASAVAGAVAANACLDRPYPIPDLLEFALAGEAVASGTIHADNVAPSLLGGLVLTPPALLPRTVELDVPSDWCSVVVHPNLTVNTAESRQGLSPSVSQRQWLEQQGYLAGFLAGLTQHDEALVTDCLRDVIVEPQRAASVPCLAEVQSAARRAGAMGSSLSGSGPSIFALATCERADSVAEAMREAVEQSGLACELWVSPMDAPGARLEES